MASSPPPESTTSSFATSASRSGRPPDERRLPRGARPMSGVGRKADHLRIAAEDDVAHARGTGLDALRLRHRALPERDLADVSLETSLLGATLGAPLLVSAMTGGTEEAGAINARLARSAAEHRLALVLG